MQVNKVLLVDDDTICNTYNSSIIRKMNLARNIVFKSDGREALKYVLGECGKNKEFPELIFLDLKMPGMDGFDFLQKVEKHCRKVFDNIVIVILTSSNNADDIVRLRNIGNYFLISKPLTKDKLLDVYHRYFRRSSLK